MYRDSFFELRVILPAFSIVHGDTRVVNAHTVKYGELFYLECYHCMYISAPPTLNASWFWWSIPEEGVYYPLAVNTVPPDNKVSEPNVLNED